jgi:CubicO group peptidase (beta-lactamase class C family)
VQTKTIARDKLDALLQRARREIDEGLLPACQIAVAKDGELVAFETFGDATDDTKFAIFSETKALICSLVWMLLGDGKVALDQRICDLVPGFGKENVTLEHVLSHSGGFPQAFLNPFIWDDVQARRTEFASWPLEWEPGTRYEYHALSGHWVLCDIIETFFGVRYTDVLRERVLEPLGLKTFILGGDEAARDIAPLQIVGEVATPEEIAAAGLRELGPPQHEQLLALADAGVRTAGIPAGGAISTAPDVAMFYQALLANPNDMWNGDVLIDATTHIRNLHLDVPRGFSMNYGLGVRIGGDDDNGVGRGLANAPTVFGHDGAGGQIAWADRATGLSLCYLTNGLDDNLLRQRRRVAGISHRALACAN